MMEIGYLAIAFLLGVCITLCVVAIAEINSVMKEIDKMLGGNK